MSKRNENRLGYKDSKVGWIPEEWECVRLEDVADVRFSNVDKKSHKGEQAVRLCNYTDVYYNAHISDAISFMSATAMPREIERYSLQKGDVLITKDSETADDIAVPALVDRDFAELLKKGLMQQLLSGRMRFPEFGKPVEKRGELPEGWEERPIGSIAHVSFSGVDKKTHTDEIPVRLCNYMDVYANDYITVDLNFMPATASASEIERFLLRQGDVMITKDSETPDDIGIPAVVTEKLENVVCGYHLALIRPNSVEVNPVFLSKELGSARSRKHFTTHANGATRFGLTTSAVMKTTVHLPTTDEQKRIAGTLSTCDREIELLKKKQEKLLEQKKGLMQKLLTGEIRVEI